MRGSLRTMCPTCHRPSGENRAAIFGHPYKAVAGGGSQTAISNPNEEGRMRRSLLVVGCAVVGLLVLPALAFGDGATLESLTDEKNADLAMQVGINSIWVLVAGILVMFMQAGFAFLEIGFSRGKNVGTVVAKILVNFGIAALAFWAVGFAFAFGEGNDLIGTHGFFLS